MHPETSELWNSLEHPRKFPEMFGNSRIIFGNSDTWQEKNLMPLAQKKLAGTNRIVALILHYFRNWVSSLDSWRGCNESLPY